MVTNGDIVVDTDSVPDGVNWIPMKSNDSGYPAQINIKMNNEETIIYKR